MNHDTRLWCNFFSSMFVHMIGVTSSTLQGVKSFHLWIVMHSLMTWFNFVYFIWFFISISRFRRPGKNFAIAYIYYVMAVTSNWNIESTGTCPQFSCSNSKALARTCFCFFRNSMIIKISVIIFEVEIPDIL